MTRVFLHCPVGNALAEHAVKMWKAVPELGRLFFPMILKANSSVAGRAEAGVIAHLNWFRPHPRLLRAASRAASEDLLTPSRPRWALSTTRPCGPSWTAEKGWGSSSFTPQRVRLLLTPELTPTDPPASELLYSDSF